jgi:hypothetical protein
MRWLLGRRCRTCGVRGFRPCGVRASEKVWVGGGYFWWKKFSPCSEVYPGGVNPDAGKLDECGGLDDLSDCFGS